MGRVTQKFYTRDHLADFIAATGAEVGEHSYGCPAIRWWGEEAKLRIGRYCSIADSVSIFLGGNHRPDWVSTYPFNSIPAWPDAASIKGHPATRGDVVIGNDVWIGDGATILSGVTVGDGAVIGARSVVTHSVPPFVIVAGNPAREIRERFPKHIAAALCRIAWWDRPDEEVRALVPLLMSGEVAKFFEAAGHEAPLPASLSSRVLNWLRLGKGRS